MFDVNKRLKELRPDHLPPGFDAKKGIAKLFPPDWRSSPCKVSQMKDAVWSLGTASGGTPSGEVTGACLVMIDWCGNWFFDFHLSTGPGQSGSYGAGFVFKFSNDGVGHGYTTTGGYSSYTDPFGNDTGGCVAQSISGHDPWIHANSKKIMAAGFEWGVGNSSGGVFGNPPPDIVKYTLQGTPFASMQNLGGAQPSPVSQSGTAIDNTPPCWFVVSSVWGVPAWKWQGGAQVGGPPSAMGSAPGPAAPWAQPGYTGSP
jgi:hypothetical protein